ncbi:hypothetical protein DB346_02805 [Verrucomicrobia bacterium LW23]|nr:hypothetical protein DB346_03850 [Verrucomicrobia bacterium LW23]PTY04378.1 hypothetical protein DB346_02805 [Verrucomicrobia bacterium LW23]
MTIHDLTPQEQDWLVRAAQTGLRSVGHRLGSTGLYSDGVDGDIGRRTIAALRDYGHTFFPVKNTGLLSPAARDLIIEFETGGQKYYEAKLDRATVPGVESGATIGCGYDLGYYTPDEIRAAWEPVLPKAVVNLLVLGSGLRRTGAQRFVADYGAAIGDIPWVAAMAVFDNVTTPEELRLTKAAFPGAEALPPDAFGVLVSIVYNRGDQMDEKPGQTRRREMRNIRELVRIGSRDAIADIPTQIRAMKRLWDGNGEERVEGLLRRREAEAVLFERAIQ